MKEEKKMDYSQEYWDKLQLFKDCIAFKKPKRIPNFSNFFTWKILDSDGGYKLSQAMTDYDVMEKVVCEFHERYQFDAYQELGGRNMYRPFEYLGARFFAIDDDKEGINYVDHVLMEGDEYTEFAKDPEALYWKMFIRRFPNLTKGQMVNAIREFVEFGAFNKHMLEKFSFEFNCPAAYNYNSVGVPFVPFELFFQFFRGIKEISIDIRRHKSELIDAMDRFYEVDVVPKLDGLLYSDNTPYIADVRTGLLGHSILSQKLFEELYWPYLKKILDATMAANKTINLYSESSILRFAEYLQDYPKGVIVIHPEIDDVIELRKALPNVCIVGGMKSWLLGHATPQECVDYAKKLVDGVGEGFIFSQDKMISYRSDCKRENLLAVNEFIRNYNC